MNASSKTEEYIIKVAYHEGTNIPRAMTVYLNEMLHSPPDGRPAQVLFNELGQPYLMGWFYQNRLHRISGPARININPENGVYVSEEFRVFGQSPKSRTEPAFVQRDPETGEILKQSFFTGKTMIVKLAP